MAIVSDDSCEHDEKQSQISEHGSEHPPCLLQVLPATEILQHKHGAEIMTWLTCTSWPTPRNYPKAMAMLDSHRSYLGQT